MPRKITLRREPALTTRSIRIASQPSGIYVRVVEQRPGENERTVEWLGKSPSLTRIREAAKRWHATIPGEM